MLCLEVDEDRLAPIKPLKPKASHLPQRKLDQKFFLDRHQSHDVPNQLDLTYYSPPPITTSNLT